MRKLFLLLAIAFLFQSCFSYRIDTKPTEMIVGKTYKIETNHKKFKARVKSINDSAVVVIKRNFDEKQIPLNEITYAKKKKFSIIKTVLIPTAIAATITGFLIVAYSGPSIGPINMFN
ncbi:hypothetical protein [Flavobacterium phycosphaerae]|uniref:hypothetical protein n=1 Tax=Flavobacterium phycosphaerae TaxID=2697515 RepID=UPI0013899F9F|nr:hypothetical protein [Flavobacterium phycosphaerae]